MKMYLKYTKYIPITRACLSLIHKYINTLYIFVETRKKSLEMLVITPHHKFLATPLMVWWFACWTANRYRSAIQNHSKAEIWFEMSGLPEPLLNSAVRSTLIAHCP